MFTHRLSADAKVSIHASHAGGDAICIASRIHSAVSIHASHAGGDLVVDNHCGVHNCFNPRLPCGRRPDWCLTVMRSKKFQSTPPMREATSFHSASRLSSQVSIHASHAGGDFVLRLDFPAGNKFQSTPPMREATRCLFQHGYCTKRFNPRLPCGRRHGAARHFHNRREVSIHASHAGGDPTL